MYANKAMSSDVLLMVLISAASSMASFITPAFPLMQGYFSFSGALHELAMFVYLMGYLAGILLFPLWMQL